MVTTCTIFGHFVTALLPSSPWWQHAPFLVILSPQCPLADHSDDMHHFWSFCHRAALKQPMVTTCIIFDHFVTAVLSSNPWWHHAPFLVIFSPRCLFQPMVTTCSIFGHLSPRCSLATHGDIIHHFWSFWHRGDLYQPMVTTFTIFGHFVAVVSSSSPWWQHAPFL